jgi:hypothetical protein
MTIPRRIRLDLATPPEVAIRAAMVAVESMSADTRLTNAGLKLGEALTLVSAYVDEQMGGVSLGDQTRSPESWRDLAESFGRRLRHVAAKYGEPVELSARLDKPCGDMGCCQASKP